MTQFTGGNGVGDPLQAGGREKMVRRPRAQVA
jgi:hypothetical protein